jgi:hypothetical protein
MAFTYSVTTNRGLVRLLVSDTSATDYTWEDAEIDAALTLALDNVYDAAATLCDTARASFKKMLSIRLFGEVSLDVGTTANHLASLAQSYRETARLAPELQMVQLQQKVDLYGNDTSDYETGSDYSEDQFNAL